MKRLEALKQLKAKTSGLNRWLEIVIETDESDANYVIFSKVLYNYIKTMEKLFRVITKSTSF